MRKLIFILAFSILAPAIPGQATSIPLTDFNRTLKAGLAVNAELASKNPYRYISRLLSREPELVTTTEVDRNGHIRTTVTGYSRGSVHQAIVVGRSIFALSGDGLWKAMTWEEYQSFESTRSAAQKKALADKDTRAYRELKSKYNTATEAAIKHSIKHMDVSAWFSHANQAVVVTFLGEGTVNGRPVRAYRYTGTSREMLRPGPHELRVDLTFWFDARTGALVRTANRLDWIYDSKTTTNGWVSEWELDPQIVVKPPEMEKPGQ